MAEPPRGDMEQPVPGRGASSLPSGASAAGPDTGTEPGNVGDPISLPGEHGDRRWEKESQQHGSKDHEISRSSEETAEETELVVLDPEHPLMRRFQAALKNYITKQMEQVNLDLHELRTATKDSKVQREELGVVLYGAQQQLVQLQEELQKSHDRHSRAATARQQLEEELEALRDAYRNMCHNTDDERKKVSAMQTQVENLALQLFYMENMDQDMHHKILLMKQSTKKAEAEKFQAEVEKKKQDLLLDQLTRRAYELQEQIALFEAQLVAQAEDTRVTRQAVSEAGLEVQAINMEKKRLINHWNSSLAGMKQRDEAYVATQELLSNYRRDLRSLEGDIHGCGKSIRKEEEKNELLVTILNRSQNDANVTEKLIAQCLLQQEALKVEMGTYTRILHETEQALIRTKMDQAAHLDELVSIRKDIQKRTYVKEQMENEIMAKLQDQMISSQAAKHFSQMAAKLRKRKTDLELHFYKVENDVGQIILNATNTSCRLTVLQKTLCEVDKDIKNISDLISCQESEIGKCRLLADKKGGIICLYNKKLEMLLAQQGGQELGPLEIEINKLTKEIEECNSEVMTLQKYWLNEQKELFRLTREREEQISSLDALKKQITIMQQRKVRMENEIQQETKEQKDIERHMKDMSNDLVKLNVLIRKNNSSFEELQHANMITENEFVHSLKAAEKESLEMQEKYIQLTEEKERLLNSIMEAEHQILLWEKKIQLAKEMKEATGSGSEQGEIQAMKAEIRRMQVRYGQLLKQQEKVVRDMEASVSRRETIAVRGEAQSKLDKKHGTKNDFQQRKQELRRKIREAQENIFNCNQAILELENTQESLRATFSEKKRELSRLQAKADGLDLDMECLQNEKRWNLLELVAHQAHQKHLQALKEGKYRAPSCTEEACRNQQEKLRVRLQTINTIVQRIREENPRHQRALQWLSQCLGSRLESEKA
ncbi:PREDICTED: coiled-coil domain-containing protein 40 isoform X1 [Lepidothrix coronata]|uniref:Coiled-coil domain-containing protein 40 isoform X1 n=2 Tax=Lepidothrix coronata TaxID=321398 RepID=A0A6J0GZX1_9PASS|nr:PREDICTED: coiled-coil domain-containing protein 40 isoform X1 [Lepidothrix coronata]